LAVPEKAEMPKEKYSPNINKSRFACLPVCDCAPILICSAAFFNTAIKFLFLTVNLRGNFMAVDKRTIKIYS